MNNICDIWTYTKSIGIVPHNMFHKSKNFNLLQINKLQTSTKANKPKIQNKQKKRKDIK